MPRSSLQRLLANLLLLAGTLLACLLVGELVLRMRVGRPVHFRFPQESYQADPDSAYRLSPGQAYTHAEPVSVSSLGLRAAEVPRVPSAGTQRILAIGDSQTFGVGLPFADTWPAQTEIALARVGGGRRWEVLNAGLPGSDTCQQAGLLQRLLRELEFQSVVLGFYVNDVACLTSQAPFALHRTSDLAHRILFALKRSAVFAALWQARVPLSNWLEPDPGLRFEKHVVDGSPDPLVDAGWERVKGFLTDMKTALDAHGIAFTILVIPRRDQIQDTAAGAAYQQRIAAIGASLGIPTVDALEALREAYRAHGEALFIAWDGHNSGLANRAIAELLAKSLAADPR